MTGSGFRARRLLVSLPLIAMGCSVQAARDAKGQDLQDVIDREARKLIDQGISDSFVVGVVKPGRTYVRGFGDRVPDGDTVFQIGSLTKLFTVATLLSLAEDGLMSLDDDLARLLGGRVQLAPRIRAITLRQLASHTSGLPPVPQPLMALARDDADPYRQLSREVIYRYLSTAEGLRSPGRFEYSNYGMGLLGHVLEDRAGASLEQLMAARILAPLSMSSTFMTPQEGPIRSLAAGSSQAGDAAKAWRFGALSGAGGLCSSVNDLLAFIQANLAAQGPVTSVLRTLQGGGEPHALRLGWFGPSVIDRIAGNRTILWHNGRVGGYAAYLSIDVVQRTGVVMLSARSAEITMPGVMLTRAVREHDLASN